MPAYAKLEDRLSRAAGAHFGEGRAIYDDQGATASTHMHELIHDRIFYETADGIFHLLAFRLAADAPNSNVGRASRKIATALFGDTRAPHEAAATYMGLMYGLVDLVTLRAKQQLKKGTRPAEYEELPPDYRDHLSGLRGRPRSLPPFGLAALGDYLADRPLGILITASGAFVGRGGARKSRA
jgi:hypothetical protein